MEIALRDTGWQEALIVPIGDLQLGASGSKPDKLRRHIEAALKHPNPWFIGMGDYIDFLSPSNRARLGNASLYDDATNVIRRAAFDLADRFLHIVRGTEGRWLEIHEGHHFWESDGMTTDMYIAEKLKAPFGGTSSFVGLRFRRPKSNATLVYSIACHHGQGGGKRIGAPLTKLEDWAMGLEGINLVLMGHATQMPTGLRDKIRPHWGETPEIKAKTIRYAVTGGWCVGYEQGSRVGTIPRGSYVEKGMMHPNTVGAPVFGVRPVHANGSDRFEDWERK